MNDPTEPKKDSAANAQTSADPAAQPTSRRGGRRPGAGQRKFVPTDEQKAFVKLLIGSGRPHEHICKAIFNPSTKKAIGCDLFVKAFAHEIEIGRIEAGAIVSVSMFAQIKKGNMTSIIWYTKNVWGWRDHPEPTKPAGNDEYAGQQVIHVRVTGGLP